jgi:hypothetical protein
VLKCFLYLGMVSEKEKEDDDEEGASPSDGWIVRLPTWLSICMM